MITDEEATMSLPSPLYASLLRQVQKQSEFITELMKHNSNLEEWLLRSDRAWKFMVAAWVLLTAFTPYNWFK